MDANFEKLFELMDEVMDNMSKGMDKSFAQLDKAIEQAFGKDDTEAEPNEHTHHIRFKAKDEKQRMILCRKFLGMADDILRKGETKLTYKTK